MNAVLASNKDVSPTIQISQCLFLIEAAGRGANNLVLVSIAVKGHICVNTKNQKGHYGSVP